MCEVQTHIWMSPSNGMVQIKVNGYQTEALIFRKMLDAPTLISIFKYQYMWYISCCSLLVSV